MTKTVVHLEDNLLDHKLVSAQLAGADLPVRMVRVDTAAEFQTLLETGPVDLILSDYNLPQFDGLAALAIAKRVVPNVPFILVSGAIGEQAAIDAIKSGATDYVLKDHLDRLVPAVRRAFRESADRAAREKAEHDVREARDIAEAANLAKVHFLAVLSHELRTPLTPALTAIEMMEGDPALPAEYREPVAMIRRNVQLEVKLIDDLLDLTRVSRGQLELDRRPTDAHESIRQVLKICHDDLTRKQLTATVEFAAARSTVLADPARLQQILWNVIKNAVKFTPEGGRIDVRTNNLPDDRWELTVTDTGIGIEPEAAARIFDAFEQGGKQITRQFGGLGLGLAISRALAEQHGGRLSACSEGTGHGACFSLTMPLAPSAAEIPVTPRSPRSNGLAGCRILLVDDHVDTARAMGTLLRRWGCEVRSADSVAAALAAADGDPFDVLISDIGLPDGTGLDIIRELSRRGPVRGIAVSGFGMEEDLASSITAGFTEHLVKPVDLSKLESTLRRVLGVP